MNIPLLPTTIVNHKAQVRCESSVPDQYTLIDKNSGRMHHLNITASMIWDLCRQSITIQAISDHVVEEYDVDNEQAFNDICRVVLHLNELDVIELA